MGTIRINAFENHPPMVLSSTTSELPDHARFNVLAGKYNAFAAVLEGAADSVGSEQKFLLKLAETRESILKLEHEYEYYVGGLSHLQGVAVPRCFGIFTGSVGDNAVACLVLEYLETIPEEYNKRIQRKEKRERLISHINKIHDAGVVINHPEGCLRYVGPWDDPRIIDFSASYPHVCAFDPEINAEEGCHEIMTLSLNYQAISNGQF
ncbi:hypothetical protein HYPSUDRAFT_57867 [Hypholoma sublateritium FD-334 SS-4]|uniref:Protein kinase domain-containing protein n=1 Tax=Hypholoma sublateritium (strain FD-334 SS-4) TaxID=945553 RepID=A0A0D2NKU3_HYPSF|nr:hypothetical protein HYPSUDRAFT_57867 [Hypholoma sublateritium FD-334 SS-4]